MPIYTYFIQNSRPCNSSYYTKHVCICIKSPNDATRYFQICQCKHENCISSYDTLYNQTVYTTCPIQLLEKIFTMMNLRRIVRLQKAPDGQIMIIVSESFYTIGTYFKYINLTLLRTIFNISANDAKLIVKNLGIEHFVYCIEECDGYCLVVLEPHSSISRGMIEPDFQTGQTWTRFKEEADMLIAKKTTASAVSASATVPESGK